MTSSARSICFALAVLLAACTSAPTPTAIASSTPTFTPTLIASPTASPITTPAGTQTASPSATATPAATPAATPTITPAGTLATQLDARLRQVLDQQRTTLNIPGISAAITFPDGSTWTAALGMAEVVPARVATTSTPFVVGSISKTFVAAAILQLVDEGALALDDPLSDWLPDYPNAGQITLRMLLSHTSGVFNLYESPNYNRLVVNRVHRTWTPQDVLAKLAGTPYCAPGACYHYSNTGFILLGLVIEAETGKPLGQVYRERFYTPLGLASTYFQGDGPPPSTSARGYRKTKTGNVAIDDGSNYRPTQSEGTVIWSAGGIVASARNIATWARALYGGDVLSAQSLARMTAFTFHPEPQGGWYGLGTRMRSFQGINMEGHTGTLRAFNAAMWYLPSLDLTVVVMTNRTGIDANAITDALLAVAVPAIP
ncbi:MAG: serine hydrolase [Chloroflexota bacterium]|nr:serine hydrolase [Chloroflexota bacterium]